MRDLKLAIHCMLGTALILNVNISSEASPQVNHQTSKVQKSSVDAGRDAIQRIQLVPIYQPEFSHESEPVERKIEEIDLSVGAEIFAAESASSESLPFAIGSVGNRDVLIHNSNELAHRIQNGSNANNNQIIPSPFTTNSPSSTANWAQ